MAALVYILGTLVTLLCATLLLRGYRQAHTPLLLWGGLCFTLLTASNALLFIDMELFPHADLYILRLGTAAFGMLLLLYGLVFESE